MLISISGSNCLGKTTFLKAFLKNWPMYRTLDKTPRDFLKEKNLNHSENLTKDTQLQLLNFMVGQLKGLHRKDNVVLDRCPLDNLIYSMWAFEKKLGSIDETFIQECISIVRDSLCKLDIIFYIPITKHGKTPILVEDGFRSTDPQFRLEVDNIFKIMSRECRENPKSVFFRETDRPAMIEVFGDTVERLKIASYYIDSEGDAFGEEHSIITPEIARLGGLDLDKYK